MDMLCRQGSTGSAVAAPAERPRVVDVLRRFDPAVAAARPLGAGQLRLLRDAGLCRTAALGGHVLRCDHCGLEVPLYNSCRNRNCPNCQALEQERWIQARSERLLPVGHHHVVFTVPAQLRSLFQAFPVQMLAMLQTAVRETLLPLCAQRHGMIPGVTAVLHTWTRELLYHPHVHCIVSAGGLSLDRQRWISKPNFLLPVALLRAAFRARLLANLDLLFDRGELSVKASDGIDAEAARTRLFKSMPRQKKWVVYIERPFGRSTHVLSYLGRYTHRVAIGDARMVSLDEEAVVFRTRGDDICTLRPVDFVSRFLQHILPKGLNKIRHYGLYAPAAVRTTLPVARGLLSNGDADDDPADAPTASASSDPQTVTDEPLLEAAAALLQRLTGVDPRRCPACAAAPMSIFAVAPERQSRARGPP